MENFVCLLFDGLFGLGGLWLSCLIVIVVIEVVIINFICIIIY